MLQPKVYIKELNIVREVEMIDFYNKQVLVYVIGVRPRGETAIYSFNEVEFMENTGLKDKHGDYVYVGDIVKLEIENETYFEVVKKEKNYNAFTLEDENSCVLFTIDDGQFLEIVGNIYKNKELLK